MRIASKYKEEIHEKDVIVRHRCICGRTFDHCRKRPREVFQSSTDADRWDAIEYSAPPECSLSPEECAVKMLTEPKIDVGSEPKFSVYPLGETNDGNVTVVFVSRFVDDDELVLGKLFRLELERSDAADTSYSLDGLGVMFQCMNGPVGWRKTPCQ